MQELLTYAAAGRLRERETPVGEPLEVFLPTAGAVEATVQMPDGRSETTRTQAIEDGAVLRWTDTDLSGIYRAVVGSGPREHLFAVNVPVTNETQQASESNLTRTNRDELTKVYPEWDVQVVLDPSQVVRTATTATGVETIEKEQGTQIAHWLLLGVLALVLAEIVIAWQFGHHADAERGAEGVAPAALPKAGSGLAARAGRLALRLLPVVLFAFALAVGVVLLHDAVTADFLGFLPDALRRSAENGLGIPEPAEGEGTRWRLEYSSYFWDAVADPWLAGLVAAATLALTAFAYRRELRGTDRRLRWLLVGLRFGRGVAAPGRAVAATATLVRAAGLAGRRIVDGRLPEHERRRPLP